MPCLLLCGSLQASWSSKAAQNMHSPPGSYDAKGARQGCVWDKRPRTVRPWHALMPRGAHPSRRTALHLCWSLTGEDALGGHKFHCHPSP